MAIAMSVAPIPCSNALGHAGCTAISQEIPFLKRGTIVSRPMPISSGVLRFASKRQSALANIAIMRKRKIWILLLHCFSSTSRFVELKVAILPNSHVEIFAITLFPINTKLYVMQIRIVNPVDLRALESNEPDVAIAVPIERDTIRRSCTNIPATVLSADVTRPP
jgi:hypothetical protein